MSWLVLIDKSSLDCNAAYLFTRPKNLFLLFPSRSSRISPISFRVLYTPSILLVMTISSIRHLLIYCCKAIFGRRAERLAIFLSNLGY